MCLAVPMRVIEVQGDLGRVEQAGVSREVSFALLEQVSPGDYVLVHAGFAIERLDRAEAQFRIELISKALADQSDEPGPV
jgi:hydrogenase expression/formation protein HypC